VCCSTDLTYALLAMQIRLVTSRFSVYFYVYVIRLLLDLLYYVVIPVLSDAKFRMNVWTVNKDYYIVLIRTTILRYMYFMMLFI
jgi:hypothetical protein